MADKTKSLKELLEDFRNRFSWKKQLVDQTAHLLWAFLVVVIGLNTAAPILGYVFIGIHVLGIIYREWLQGKSSRWWDQPLDYTFFTLGFILGLWL